MNALWSHIQEIAYLLMALSFLGTNVAIAARWYANYKIQRKFVADMATNHLPHIYHALAKIGASLGLELDEPPAVQWVQINGNGKNGH